MENRRDKIIAGALTLVVAVLICTALLCVTVTPATANMPVAAEDDETEIFFTDIEYKEVASNPTPEVDGRAASAAASEPSGTDLQDQGSGESAPEPVTTPAPHPEQAVRQEPKPDPGPTREEIEEQKRQAIRERMGRASGLKATSNEGTGKSTAGEAQAGDNPGSDGLGLDGRKRLNKPDPGIRNASGWVEVDIAVNSAGTVTRATVKRSSGFGTREAEVRAACVKASEALRYSADKGKARQTGTIRWIIK